MKRRTLDIIFVVGGGLLAVLMLVLGLVLKQNADFAKSYVHDQLSAQKIFFTPADKLTDEEKKAVCLVTNGSNGPQESGGGQQLLTGKQAECYSNEYIALHLSEVNGGKTYAQTSNESRAARAKADAALKADPNAQASKDLDTAAKALSGKVETLFKGETLRGLLLTSYGFSIFGEKAALAANVCFAIALVLLLAAIAGLVHAIKTPKDVTVFSHHNEEPAPVA
jgi:hypothetical protein